MTRLIASLAATHGALITEITASANKDHTTTARRIEATLIQCLKGLMPSDFGGLLCPILNSGSLKALKSLPETTVIARNNYGSNQPDADFILAQPAAYIREAQKRGFALSDARRTALVAEIATQSSHVRLRGEAMALSGPVSPWMMGQVLISVLGMPHDMALLAAPLAARLLRKGAKDFPEGLHDTALTMLCIHDPAAAHQHLFASLAIYTLLGARKPAEAALENADMKRLARKLFCRAGKTMLQEQMGGIEGILAGSHRKPVGILAEFQEKRLYFKAPATKSRGRY